MKLPDEPQRWEHKDAGGKGWPVTVVPAHAYDKLRSLCEQLKEDAERYRWLRSMRESGVISVQALYRITGKICLTPTEMDAVIDAAPKESDDKA